MGMVIFVMLVGILSPILALPFLLIRDHVKRVHRARYEKAFEEMLTLSGDGEAFHEAFNRAADELRKSQ